jgi:tRNA G10  N-methylase Trm11
MPAIETPIILDHNQEQDNNPYTLVQAKKKKTKIKQQRVTVTTPEEMGTPDKMEEDTAKTEDPPTPPPIETPPIINSKRECRYLVIVTAPPSTEPWKAFTDLLKKFLQYIHDQTTKQIYIATWDPEREASLKKQETFSIAPPRTGRITPRISMAIQILDEVKSRRCT